MDLEQRVKELEDKIKAMELSSTFPLPVERALIGKNFPRSVVTPKAGQAKFYVATSNGGATDTTITFENGIYIL